MTKEELKNCAELQNSSDRPVTNRDYFIDLFYPLFEAKDKEIASLKAFESNIVPLYEAQSQELKDLKAQLEQAKKENEAAQEVIDAFVLQEETRKKFSGAVSVSTEKEEEFKTHPIGFGRFLLECTEIVLDSQGFRGWQYGPALFDKEIVFTRPVDNVYTTHQMYYIFCLTYDLPVSLELINHCIEQS